MRAFVRRQCLPIGYGCIPVSTLWAARTAFQIVKRLFIRRDEASTSAPFNGHVADRHAAFHGKGANSLACIFHHIARTTSRANLTNDGKNDVFRCHVIRQRAVHFDLHVFGFGLDQRLRGQHMFHFRRANAVGQRAKRTVSRCMAVTTDNRCTRQREALFGSHDMHNALTDIEHFQIFNAKVLGVLFQRLNLNTALFIRNAVRPAFSWHIVVSDGQCLFRRTHCAA